MMLYDASRHELLSGPAWSEAAAREHIVRIAADTLAAFSPQGLWPNHPGDVDDGEADVPRANLYLGAGGVIWALERLRRLGAFSFEHDFSATVATLPALGHEFTNEWGHGRHSWLMGETGLLMLQWQHGQSDAVADALFAAVEANLHHPAQEALLGSPGSMLAALFMAEATGDPRWQALFSRAVQILWDGIELDADFKVWLWVQDLYGQKTRYLGGAHGFAGNLQPVLRGQALLPAALVQGFAERALDTLTRTARRDDERGQLNWPSFLRTEPLLPRHVLVQDCHGAPGIICRFGHAPATPEWDALLLAGGELTWAAGPLNKGPGLCHGTAGNGYALLKLYKRSGNMLWLDRARAFAMHAAQQADQMAAELGRRRFSLWNGDPGVALFLQSCLDGDDALPTLDNF